MSSRPLLVLLLFWSSTLKVVAWSGLHPMLPTGKIFPQAQCQAVKRATGSILLAMKGVDPEKEGSACRRRIAALPDLVGKGALAQILVDQGVSALEIPCIAFQPLDVSLETVLAEHEWELVVITAPEAASLFAKAWNAAARPSVNVACVGEKTKRELADGGVDPATLAIMAASGKDLASRAKPSGTGRVLLPVSRRARKDLQEALTECGYSVERVDVYDTVAVEWSEQQLAGAKQSSVVALASPSAIQVWSERVGTEQHAVCFGESSADGCRRAGFRRVSFPSRKGLQGWADEIARATAESKAGE